MCILSVLFGFMFCQVFTLITWAVFGQDEEKALLFAVAFPYMIAKIFYKLGKKVFKKA